MPNTALIVLADYANTPKEYIGERAYDLGRLDDKNIPVPRSFCLTLPTLKAIADANNLKLRLASLLEKVDFSSAEKSRAAKRQLLNLFSHLRIPRNISSEIISAYHHYLGQSHVHILPSNLPTSGGEWVHSNVKGDANVIDSLMQIWAQVVFANAVHTPKNTPAATLLFSTPFLVEWAPATDASGVIYTKDPESGSKTEMAIRAVWGVYHQDQSEAADHIKVDVRTWNVVSQSIAKKEQQFSRGIESLRLEPVPTVKQNQPALNRSQAEQLTRIAFDLKQQSLDQLKIHWLLSGGQLLVTAVEPDFSLETTQSSTPSKTVKIKSAISLYISAGNPDRAASQVSDLIDGIGVLKSEYTLAKFGIHPQHALKSKRLTTLLKDDLVKTIQTYQRYLAGRPLIYRTQNFTSAELLKLNNSSMYEPKEANPYLGYRGGMKISSAPELFNLELSALNQVLIKQKPEENLGCMLPFIRTPGELRTAIEKISAAGLLRKSNFKIWLQLNTPENILNLESYPLQQVDGLSINVSSLHGLIAGIDPDDKEQVARYPLPTKTILHLISHTLAGLDKSSGIHHGSLRPKVFLHLENFSHDLTAEAVKLGIDGIIVKPYVAQLARECIIDTESFRLTKG